MNRTSLSVIALAIGAVLIIGLYNVYRPQTKSLVDKVFNKLQPTVHHYDGLNYISDDDNVEFISGRLNIAHCTPGHGLVGPEAPKDIHDAKFIKFDDKVDVSHQKSMWGMLDYDPNVESIDLGNNFDDSLANNSRNDWTGNGIDSLFDNDPHLAHVNLGPKFQARYDNGTCDSIFRKDGMLHWNDINGNKSGEALSKSYSNRQMTT